jgi:hypothetical protein
LSGWRDWSVEELLFSRDLTDATERPFATDGWSGATFTALERGEERFVIKRTSLTIDWIARATDDTDLREAWIASDGAETWKPFPSLPVPYLGAAADGDGTAILMPDLSNELIAWERPGHAPAIDEDTLRRVLEAMARLHATRLGESVATGGGSPPWCPLHQRLLLLSPVQAARYREEDNPVGDRFLAGWSAFNRLAPPSARHLIEELADDVGPLVLALGRLPSVGLHGDMKLANVALFPNGGVALIDWQMTLRAPVAVELGWFLVSNSASVPDQPEAVLESYRRLPSWGLDTVDVNQVLGNWEAQSDLTWIIGLLLRGWRKGLDAEADVVLPTGLTAAADLAWWSERAVEAADRRL